MKRLTTDTPQNNIQNALNLFYIKDSETWVRGGGPGPEYADVSLFDFTRQIVREHALDIDLPENNDSLANMMPEWLCDGSDTMEGVIALLYTAAWTYAELRHRLMQYEDTGLAPDTIRAVFGTFHESDRAELEELRALLRAKHEGRLVVLPCKVGDTVYFRTWAKSATVDCGIQPHEVTATRAYVVVKGEFTDVGIPVDHFGATAFLTREAAEDALKGGAADV